ncbi:MAG: hypothetical protein ACOYOB_19580 [Myxococcota bacterium]
MPKATRQVTAWEYLTRREIRIANELDKIGPFPVQQGPAVCRLVDCANYDGCLSFAANRRWMSFSCVGCRKAQEGTFE